MFSLLLPGVLVVSRMLIISAQITYPPCASGFTWMNNAQQQSPCYVAGDLQAACANGQWIIDSIGSGQYYLGPKAGNGNYCTCSDVVYNLLSACGVCQGGYPSSFAEYAYNCTTAYVSYQGTVPSDTSIPAWAQLDTSQGSWNEAQASALASQPSSTSSAAPSTASTTSMTTATPTASPSPSPTPSPSSIKSTTPVGAIAGGVVGGVAALIIAAVAIWYCVRRGRTRDPGNSPDRLTEPEMRNSQGFPSQGQPMDYSAASPVSHAGFSTGSPTSPAVSPAATPAFRGLPEPQGNDNRYTVYDPNNPATYPDAQIGGMNSGHNPGTSPTSPSHQGYTHEVA